MDAVQPFGKFDQMCAGQTEKVEVLMVCGISSFPADALVADEDRIVAGHQDNGHPTSKRGVGREKVSHSKACPESGSRSPSACLIDHSRGAQSEHWSSHAAARYCERERVLGANAVSVAPIARTAPAANHHHTAEFLSLSHDSPATWFGRPT